MTGEGDEGDVTHPVTMGVVDGLEVVYVQQHQEVVFLQQGLFQDVPSRQPGQVICQCQGAQAAVDATARQHEQQQDDQIELEGRAIEHGTDDIAVAV
ncbi:hypothetical protein D3C73_479810 [compost metagenome]